jgi:hypothetical protein
VFLLLIADYLMARVLATLIEWLSHVKGGTAILFAMLIGACMLPALLIPRLANAQGQQGAAISVLSYTPPFAAAALMANASVNIARAYGLLVGWIAALLILLAAIERQAAKPRSAEAAALTWDDRYERIASVFGPAMAPLVARTLRYYVRSNKVRFNYIAALPALAFLTFNQAGQSGASHFFVRGLGSFALVGFLGTAVMSTNQFGFDSSGFRRYFLLPIAPGRILRASSYTALAVGGTLLAAALLLWLSIAPVPFDVRLDSMLAASGVAGLFLFNALAMWTSLLAARATNFETTFGNQLSLSANVLLIGGVLCLVFGTIFLDKSVGPEKVLSYWWTAVLAAVAAVAFYVFSLQIGARVFVDRKERLLNALEGRN